MHSGKIVVVTPTFNEAQNVERLAERLFALKMEITLIAVDDNSPDGTAKILDRLVGKYPIEIIHRNKKSGYGTASVVGLKAALKHKPDRVVQMDADLSHDPRAIPRLVSGNADLVIGSRYTPGGQVKQWESCRRILSRAANLYARIILGLKTKDVTSGYRCWQPEALARVLQNPLDSLGYVFLPETAYYAQQLGFTVAEIPITFAQRTTGKSKLTFGIFWESSLKILRLRVGY